MFSIRYDADDKTQKQPPIRNPLPKLIPRRRIAREPQTAHQRVEQDAGVNRGVYLRRDLRRKPGPKAKTPEEKLEIILKREERYKNVGRKRKPKEVDIRPDELKEPCVKRKMPKFIKADENTAKEILKGK